MKLIQMYCMHLKSAGVVLKSKQKDNVFSVRMIESLIMRASADQNVSVFKLPNYKF